MAQLNFDIIRLDGHTHDGINSSLLPLSSFPPYTVSAPAASWVLNSSGYSQVVTVPAGVTEFNLYELQCYIESDTPYVTACDTHSNTTVDGIASVALGIRVGMLVSGSGIPAGTYVQSIVSDTQITLSQAATTSLSATSLTFTMQGQRIYLQANRLTATTFILFCNDATLTIKCLFR
jgi:hypothetical protein